jgi:hypothetical protein
MADWWHNRPWRLIQTNLREIDMRDIRAARVVADLLAFKANVLMINAAGIIASYPTKLPFQFQSPYLTGDSLHDIIAACHAADIRVIARTDFSKVRRVIYEQHPDWAYRTAAGAIVDYNGDVHACLNGPYQQEYAQQIIEELLSTHDFDGIFFNMGGYQTRDYSGNYHGICHCANCQRRFRELYDLALPAQEDMADPVFRRYVEFKRRTVKAHGDKVYGFISSRWPHLCIANHVDFRRGFIRQESNTALDRPLPHWQYSGSDNTKWAVGTYPEMVSSNTSVDFVDFPYRHVAVAPHQQALRLAQGLANGGAIDYYLIGRLDNHADRSGFAAVKDIFHFHAAHEDVYRDLRSRANIALLKPSSGNDAEYRGWFRVLAESHYLFDVLMSDAATGVPWDRYQAIVVPGIEPLGDELAVRLDQFVSAGGTLIATGQSGFRDDRDEPRAGPALACLGIQQVRTVRPAAEVRSSYLQVDADRVGASDFDLVYVDSSYVYAQYAPAAEPHMRLIPPHPFGPPERCYYEQITDHPGYVVHPHGQGRAIYLPWLPGAQFHRQGYTNTSEFCAALLRDVAQLQSVGGNLPPQVEVTVFEKRDGSGLLVHLVNGTGHFGNSFYAPLPLRDVDVVVPCARPSKSVRGLRKGTELRYAWIDGRLTINVPVVKLFEAVWIECGE